VIGATPDCPAMMAAQVLGRSLPKGEIVPAPVTTMSVGFMWRFYLIQVANVRRKRSSRVYFPVQR